MRLKNKFFFNRFPAVLAAALLLVPMLTGANPQDTQVTPKPKLSTALREIETLYNNKKYAIVLEKALGILNTGKNTITPVEGGFLHYYVGMAYKGSGDEKNAAVYFKKVEQQYPLSQYMKQTYLELADIYKADYFQKVSYLEQLYQKYPQTPEAIKAGIDLSRGYMKLKNYRKALPILETVVNVWKKGDENPELYMLLAVAYSGINDYIEALDYLRRTEKKVPKLIDANPDYLFEAGKISHNNTNFDKGIIYLEKLFNVYPNYKRYPEASIILAQCYEREKKHFLSAVFLIKAIEKKPAQRYMHTLMLNLGRVLQELDKKELTKIKRSYPLHADSKKLLTLVKNNSLDFEQRRTAAILLSGALKKADNLEQAVDNYYKFLGEQRDPLVEKLFKENLDKYLDGLAGKKQYEKMFQAWVKLKGRKSFLSADNLVRFGELLKRMKLYANAREVFTHITKYKMYRKFWPTAYGQLARIEFIMGKYDDCLSYIARLNIDKEPEKSEFKLYETKSYLELKKTEDVKEQLETIKPDAIENIYHYRLYGLKAAGLEKQKEYDEALRFYQLMRGYQPVPDRDRALLLIALADVHFKKQDLITADDYYREAEPLNVNIDWILYRRIKIARTQKQKEAAAEMLAKFKQIKPDSFWLTQLEKEKLPE